MRRSHFVVGLIAVVLACGLLGAAIGQEQRSAKLRVRVTKAAQQRKQKAKRNPYRRVPRFWGQIGLTQLQKEQIYTIQAAYGEKIEKLQEQIDQLEQEQEKARLAVLSEEQGKRLKERLAANEAAKKKRAARKGKKKSKKSSKKKASDSESKQ